MKYILGLDMGIASVGWAVLNLDMHRIENLGVRAFMSCEEKNSKAPPSSKAAPRRIMRSQRRRLRRRVGRLNRIKQLFIDSNLISQNDIPCFPGSNQSESRSCGKCVSKCLFVPSGLYKSPWQLRAEGIDRLLLPQELAICLYHIAKHRGYKSNRKTATSEPHIKSSDAAKQAEESRKALTGIANLRKRLSQSQYETVGQFLYREWERTVEDRVISANSDTRVLYPRLRNTTDVYEHTIHRDLLVNEIEALFEKQEAYGSTVANTLLKDRFLTLMNWQLPYTNSELINSKVGRCQLLRDEPRSPKNTYTAERFNLLQALNHLRITSLKSPSGIPLSLDQRDELVSIAYKHGGLTYTQIRQYLADSMPDDGRFNISYYVSRKAFNNTLKDVSRQETRLSEFDIEDKWNAYQLSHWKKAEDRSLVKLPGWTKLKTGLGSGWELIANHPAVIDELAKILTFNKDDEQILKAVDNSEVSIPQAVRNNILNCENFDAFHGFSHKALLALIHELEQEVIPVSEAILRCNFPKQDNNLSQFIPVIDGETLALNPVVYRTMCQARKVVNEIIRLYGSPFKIHIEFARDLGHSWKSRQENGYKQKVRADERLADKERFVQEFKFEPHGDTLLKFELYLEQKGKCLYSGLPLDIDQLLKGMYEVDHIVPYSKSFDNRRSNLALVTSTENRLKGNRTPYEYFGHNQERWSKFVGQITGDIRNIQKRNNLLLENYDSSEMTLRNITDTRYAIKAFKTFIEQHLEFSPDAGKRKVVCLAGAFTAFARSHWNIKKDRNIDTHHAVDAAIIAALTEEQCRRFTLCMQQFEDKKPYADPITGEIIEPTELYRLKLPQPWRHFRDELLLRLSDTPEQILDNNWTNYSDRPSIKRVYVSRPPRCKMNGPMHKETITSLKKKPDGVPVRCGVAAHELMVRLDIFTKAGKYYMKPYYVADYLSAKRAEKCGEMYDMNGELVPTSSTAKKQKIDDSYTYCFSLHKDDLIEFDDGYFYLTSLDIGGNKVKVKPVNCRSAADIRKAILSQKVFKKLIISPLGEIHAVKKEKRLGLANSGHRQTIPAEG